MIRSQAGVIDPHELKDDRVLVDAIWLRQSLPMSLWIDRSVLGARKPRISRNALRLPLQAL